MAMNTTLRIKNESKTYLTGNMYSNKYGEEYEIMGQTTTSVISKDTFPHRIKYPYFLIKYIKNSNLEEVNYSAIRQGTTKNCFHRTVKSLGYLGGYKHPTSIRGIKTKQYKLWLGLFNRCYDKSSLRRHPTYKDVTVSDRWLNFQNFCEDLPKIYNYDKWLHEQGYELDKDKIKKGNRVYDFSVCCFLKHIDNYPDSSLTGSAYVAEKEGEKIEFENFSAFSRSLELHSSTANNAFKKGHRCKGYIIHKKP